MGRYDCFETEGENGETFRKKKLRQGPTTNTNNLRHSLRSSQGTPISTCSGPASIRIDDQNGNAIVQASGDVSNLDVPFLFHSDGASIQSQDVTLQSQVKVTSSVGAVHEQVRKDEISSIAATAKYQGGEAPKAP